MKDYNAKKLIVVSVKNFGFKATYNIFVDEFIARGIFIESFMKNNKEKLCRLYNRRKEVIYSDKMFNCR